MFYIIDFLIININWVVIIFMNIVFVEFNNKKVGNRYIIIILININGKKSFVKFMVLVDLLLIDMEVFIKDFFFKEFVDFDEFLLDLILVVRNLVGILMIFIDIYLIVDGIEKVRIKLGINIDDMVGDIVIIFLDEKFILIFYKVEDKWICILNVVLKWNDINYMFIVLRCMINLFDIDCLVIVELIYYRDIKIFVVNIVID